MASRTVSHAASPIVKAGKMMWNETVKANGSREKIRAVASIGDLPSCLGPQIRSGEIDKIFSAAVEHGSEHVEREALGHLDCDGGRDREHHTAHDRINKHWPVMRERGCDALVHVC